MMTSGSRPAVSARRVRSAASCTLPLTTAAVSCTSRSSVIGGSQQVAPSKARRGGGEAGKLGLLDRKVIHSERPGGVGCDVAELPPCLRWKIGRAICRQKLVHVLAGPLEGRRAALRPPRVQRAPVGNGGRDIRLLLEQTQRVLLGQVVGAMAELAHQRQGDRVV